MTSGILSVIASSACKVTPRSPWIFTTENFKQFQTRAKDAQAERAKTRMEVLMRLKSLLQRRGEERFTFNLRMNHR